MTGFHVEVRMWPKAAGLNRLRPSGEPLAEAHGEVTDTMLVPGGVQDEGMLTEMAYIVQRAAKEALWEFVEKAKKPGEGA